MAGDTLAELLDLTYLRADIAPDDVKFNVTLMTRIINLALRRISTYQECFWLDTSASLAVVLNTSTYATSTFTRFHKMRRVSNDLHHDLLPVGKNEIESYLQNSEKPRAWTMEEGFLKLGGIPDTAYTYTAHFTQYEAPLANSYDSPALPAIYSDMLACQAGIMAAGKNHDQETVAFLRDELKEWRRSVADDMRQMKPLPHITIRPR